MERYIRVLESVSHPLISSWIAVSVGHAEMISVGSVTINSYLGGKDGEILKTVSNAKREGGKTI